MKAKLIIPLFCIVFILQAAAQAPKYRLIKQIDLKLHSNHTTNLLLNKNYFYKKDLLYKCTIDSSTATDGWIVIDSFAYDKQDRETYHVSLSKDSTGVIQYLSRSIHAYTPTSIQLIAQEYGGGTWNNGTGSLTYKNKAGQDSLFILQQYFLNKWRNNYFTTYHYKSGLLSAYDMKDSTGTLLASDSFFYDMAGNVVRETETYAGYPDVSQTSYEYNTLNQLVTKTIVSHNIIGHTDHPQRKTINVYNSNNLLYYSIGNLYNDTTQSWMILNADTDYYDTSFNLVSDHNYAFQGGSLALIESRENSYYYYEMYVPGAAIKPEPTVMQVQCYPNPVQNLLHISFANPIAHGNARLFTMDGKRTFLQELQISGDKTASIPMDTMPPGIYQLYIETDAGLFTTRVVKL